eukprot:7294693-Pyramimonas_sp.AAC.1
MSNVGDSDFIPVEAASLQAMDEMPTFPSQVSQVRPPPRVAAPDPFHRSRSRTAPLPVGSREDAELPPADGGDQLSELRTHVDE